MAATKKNEQKLNALAAFFDEGAYTELYADKEDVYKRQRQDRVRDDPDDPCRDEQLGCAARRYAGLR